MIATASPASTTHTQNRRELRLCLGAAAALVILRSIVFVGYEQLFDSDQAIVGLMAKHASELRTFPLFFYGQNYMLGVQAWIAVPFFWAGGPTVAMLRMPLVVICLAVPIGIILVLTRRGVRPVFALAAVLPLVATPPVTAGELLTTLGASVEPFLYVLLLWRLRRRPVAFGALLCAASLHREFTILAAPAAGAAAWFERRRIGWRTVALAASGFVAVWLGIDALKQMLLPGPGAAGRGESLVGEAIVIGQWLSFDLRGYVSRELDTVLLALPALLGIRPRAISNYGYDARFIEGSWIGGAALGLAAAVIAFRSIVLWCDPCRRPDRTQIAFPVYLACIGVETMLVYGLNGGILAGAPVLRYLLFTLWLPVAVLAAYVSTDPDARWTAAVAVFVVVWAVPNLYDHGRLLRAFRSKPPANEHRELADYLTAHRIRYGTATYWDAYLVDFLARERVILASADISRIPAYQRLADLHRAVAVRVQRTGCDTGPRVASWCIAPPARP